MSVGGKNVGSWIMVGGSVLTAGMVVEKDGVCVLQAGRHPNKNMPIIIVETIRIDIVPPESGGYGTYNSVALKDIFFIQSVLGLLIGDWQNAVKFENQISLPDKFISYFAE
jgi:hypothetical protein